MRRGRPSVDRVRRYFAELGGKRHIKRLPTRSAIEARASAGTSELIVDVADYVFVLENVMAGVDVYANEVEAASRAYEHAVAELLARAHRNRCLGSYLRSSESYVAALRARLAGEHVSFEELRWRSLRYIKTRSEVLS